MNNKIRALALFSGGLDSALAIRVIMDQDIDVIALNFVSYFFGGSNEKAEKMAKQLGVSIEYIDFRSRQLEVVKHPACGRGKNMNPCIDCHALMFKIAGELLKKYDADFIISGEVLGQRPMSQNYNALERVRKLSGVGNIIVRPLSGKLLPISDPIEKGLVVRDKLLDIQGRSRYRQLELVDKYGLVDYETPGGGCLLTDPAYSRRLKALEEDDMLTDRDSYLFYLIRKARVFRLGHGKYLLIGKDDITNHEISNYINNGNIQIHALDTPGPRIMMVGDVDETDKQIACELFSRYSKVKGAKETKVVFLNEKDTDKGRICSIAPIDIQEVELKTSKYQIK